MTVVIEPRCHGEDRQQDEPDGLAGRAAPIHRDSRSVGRRAEDSPPFTSPPLSRASKPRPQSRR